MSNILSLPGLSLIFNNYSASSLNLLFFYLTWSTLVLSHPPLRVEVITSLAVRIIFYIIPGILFCTFDTLLPSLADKSSSSTQQSSRYSLRSTAATYARSKTSKRGTGLRRSFGGVLLLSLRNILVGIALEAGIEYVFSDILMAKSGTRALSVTTTLPLPWDAALGILQAVILREVLVYYPHRRLHRSSSSSSSSSYPTVYPYLPIRFAHCDAPVGSNGGYSCLSHTATTVGDYIFLQWLPTYAPAVLFRFHVLTYLLFEVLVCGSEAVGYSGYDALPGFFLMGKMGRRVRGHVGSGGKGGFGWLGWLDWIHGTDVGGEGSNGATPRKGRGKGRKSL